MFHRIMTVNQPKEYWIEKLGLQPHPKEDKGFFKETFR